MLVLSNSPHIKIKDSISVVMWTVVAALLPAMIYSVYTFGIRVLYIYIVGIIGAILSEAAMRFFFKKQMTLQDGSAVLTGILLAMNVPPSAPLWMVFIGSAFAIIIVKQLFGGLGYNIFNPALAARAFLMASWPIHMTTGWHKFANGTSLSGGVDLSQNTVDVISHATPLMALKEAPRMAQDLGVPVSAINDMLFSNELLYSLFIGNVGGVIGETSALFLLIGGVFLLIRKVITWHVPAAFIGTLAILSFVYYSVTGDVNPVRGVLFQILSGGVILGAIFMATDPVTSPITGKGMLLFGVGCAVITFVIRTWGGYPEGVSYSILLMNALVPLIDKFIKPHVLGVKRV